MKVVVISSSRTRDPFPRGLQPSPTARHLLPSQLSFTSAQFPLLVFFGIRVSAFDEPLDPVMCRSRVPLRRELNLIKEKPHLIMSASESEGLAKLILARRR